MDSGPLMEVAKGIANAQARLGQSPAERDGNGSLVLCAASCIARAAIMAKGDPIELADFEDRVLYEDKHTYLGNIFEVHGIDLNASAIVQHNDITPPEKRLEWFNAL